MGWILLEAGVALGIGIFIVWWTMSARRRPPPAPPSERSDRSDQ